MTKRKLFTLSLLSTFASAALTAQMLYSYSNVELSYLDWTKNTQAKSSQRDFAYLSLESGARWDWGEFYGIANIENPHKSYSSRAPHNQRYNALADFDLEIKSGFRFHLQDFNIESQAYKLNELVVGLAYKFENSKGDFFRPYIGFNRVDDTYFKDFNGFKGGWTLMYNFSLLEQKLFLFNWNEIDFLRKKSYYQLNDGTLIGDGASYGLNGAASLWWLINKPFTAGLQYRYAKNKLGSSSYQSGMIYTLKYNF